MGLLVRQSRRIRRVVKCPNLMLYMVELHFGKKLQFHVGKSLEMVRMDSQLKEFIESTVANLNKALELDQPKLTWAVLVNTATVIESWVECAQLIVERVENGK